MIEPTMYTDIIHEAAGWAWALRKLYVGGPTKQVAQLWRRDANREA